MIVLLCEFDLPHVKTTNPAYLVVSGEKKELLASLTQIQLGLHVHNVLMHCLWNPSWALVSMGKTSFQCLETCSGMVTCINIPLHILLVNIERTQSEAGQSLEIHQAGTYMYLQY